MSEYQLYNGYAVFFDIITREEKDELELEPVVADSRASAIEKFSTQVNEYLEERPMNKRFGISYEIEAEPDYLIGTVWALSPRKESEFIGICWGIELETMTRRAADIYTEWADRNPKVETTGFLMERILPKNDEVGEDTIEKETKQEASSLPTEVPSKKNDYSYEDSDIVSFIQREGMKRTFFTMVSLDHTGSQVFFIKNVFYFGDDYLCELVPAQKTVEDKWAPKESPNTFLVSLKELIERRLCMASQ